jgi:hypothetical protein
MKIVAKLRDEFSFVRGNYLILVLSWILMGFANEMPSSYYGSFVIYDLGATAPILGFIGFSQFVGYVLMAFELLAGGIIYSISPQLPFLLMMTALLPSFLIVALLVHEPEKREAG